MSQTKSDTTDIDRVTLGRLRQDLAGRPGEMLFLIDPETNFAVCVTEGDATGQLSQAVHRISHTSGPKDAQESAQKLAGDAALKQTLADVQASLGADAVVATTRTDDGVTYLHVSASGRAAETIFAVLVGMGIVKPEDAPAAGHEPAEA